MTEDWHERLDAATTPEEVVETCRDLLGWLAPETLRSLPAACRPPVPLDADGVAEYAVALMRCDTEQGASGPPVLRTFALFFTDASDRIARISAERARKARGRNDVLL